MRKLSGFYHGMGLSGAFMAARHRTTSDTAIWMSCCLAVPMSRPLAAHERRLGREAIGGEAIGLPIPHFAEHPCVPTSPTELLVTLR